MARALVLCPTTETTELIEFVDTPLGALIHRCSLYEPATVMACNRACAVRSRCTLAEAGAAELEIDDAAEDTDIEIEAYPQALSDAQRPG